MQCWLRINGDFATVTSDQKTDTLTLDMSDFYCSIFDSAKAQSRDYLEELVRWCGARPDNIESLHKSLLMYVLVKRKTLCLK